MKVGIITDYWYPLLGGIAEHVDGQARALAARGHEVTIITGRPIRPTRLEVTEHPTQEGPFGVVRLGSAIPVHGNGGAAVVTVAVGARRRLERIARERNLDVVHVHAPYNPSLPLVAARALRGRVPIVGTFHSVFHDTPTRRAFFAALAPAIAGLDARIAVGEACRDGLEATFGAPFTVIPNGVDVDRFQPAPTTVDPRCVVWVGHWDARNGLDTTLEAMARLEASGAHLIVIGGGRGTPADRRALTALNGIATSVGPRHTSLPRLVAGAGVALCSGRIAAFGMTVVEAMACGRPVVATAVGGHVEILRDGGGILVAADDPIATANALAALIGDPQRADEIGRAGRLAVEQRYAWPVIAEQLDHQYRAAMR